MVVQTVDCTSESAAYDFTVSLHDTGFAILRNHPIPQDLLDRLYAEWSRFFDGPDKERFLSASLTGDGPQTGYFPTAVSETAVGYSTKDHKEFFHVMQGSPLPSSCAGDTLRYFDLAYALGTRLLGWLQQHAPADTLQRLSEPLQAMLSPEASVLRILHYPPFEGTEERDALRAAPHEDINLITLLPVAQQAGLQVRSTAGEWIDVSGRNGELIINSGDMLQEATGAYFPSTTHRVVNPGPGIDNVSRISIPFFLTPRPDVVLSDRYTSGAYLDERLQLLSR